MGTKIKFQVRFSFEEIEHKLRTFHREGVKVKIERVIPCDGITLIDTKANNSRLSLTKNDEGLVLSATQVSRDNEEKTFSYNLIKVGSGKTEITFFGPINALWQQNLLPKLYKRYVKGSLMGCSSGSEEFVPIGQYMKNRAKKLGAEANPQDEYGWRVNRFFNDEIPFDFEDEE